MRFTLDERTPSLNRWQRMHWAKRNRYKQRLADEVWVKTYNWPRAEKKRRVIITRHSPRQLDRDNLIGGCKGLLDALVRARILVDDAPEWVEVSYRQVKGRGMTVEVYEACLSCDGVGVHGHNEHAVRCLACEGLGYVEESS